MKITELASGLAALKAQNEKARVEIIAKVNALEQAIADLNGGELSEEVNAAFEDLKASIQADDDLNADTTPPTV